MKVSLIRFFSYVASLLQHSKIHSGLKRYHCDFCDKTFTRRGDVVRHKRLIHEKNKSNPKQKAKRKSIESVQIVEQVAENQTVIITQKDSEGVNYDIVQETSEPPDAVQTLIDAVQELIQKHDHLTETNKPNS